ncbi:MAG: ATP-binding protein [Pyrinomonadaceae bacterium]
MEDIRRQFQKSSIESLKKFLTELQDQETVSKDFIQSLFRRIHTMKGSAQIYGLTNTSGLAHTLEDILELLRGNSKTSSEEKKILTDGLKFLVLTLEYPDFVVPNSFFDRINKPPTKIISSNLDIYLTLIPPKIFDQLTEFEKLKLQTIASKDKSLICVDAVFNSCDFSDRLKELQAILNLKGEIIFTLPSEKIIGENEIGFQLFISTDDDKEDFETAVKDFDAEVDLLTAPAGFSNDLSGILSKIVSQGKNWANDLGKKAEFKILSDEPRLNVKYLNLIFEILLHLVRNAVDHSFDEKGYIEIRLKETDDGINLILTDDGKGIDLYIVRAKAIEQKLILPDTNLSEQETLDLIFLPGFSTAEKVTEISGRGIGLDEVQNLVVNARGTISVESRKDEGTVFEIFLPLSS